MSEKYPMPRTAREQLHIIEQDRNVKILFACESGSRAWGFNSNNSDFDIRFVYVRPQRAYLSLASRRDVIDAKDLRLEDKMIDLGGWDILKFLSLAAVSNAQVLEWLRSSIVYYEDEVFMDEIREIMQNFNIKSVMQHYAGMSKKVNDQRLKKTGEQVEVKAYLYTLRTILMAIWLEDAPTSFPDIEIGSLINIMRYKKTMSKACVEIEKIIGQRKFFEENHRIVINPAIEEFIAEYIPKIKQFADNAYDGRRPDMISLENLSYDTIRRLM